MNALELMPYGVLAMPVIMLAGLIWHARFSTEAKIYALGYGDEIEGLPREKWESRILQENYDRGRKDARRELNYRADKLARQIDRERLKGGRK